MTVSITDALSRIDQIEQQVESLEGGFASAGGVAGTTAASDASSSSATGSTSSTDFSGALAQAQASDAAATAASASAGAEAATAADPMPSTDTMTAADPSFATDAASDSFPTVAGSALGTPTASLTVPTVTGPTVSAVGSPTGGVAVAPPYTTAAGVTPPYTTSATDTTPYTTTGSVALPTGASTMLTSSQQQFASTLSADTGLNPGVVSSWLLAEESGGAAQSRQAAGNNDWLNIGYTGSGTFGADDSVWSDPVSAANATAQWLQGQDSIPGYGTASSGIQSILSTVGQTPETQIAALQTSGWSGSGYPSLPELYGTVTGS